MQCEWCPDFRFATASVCFQLTGFLADPSSKRRKTIPQPSSSSPRAAHTEYHKYSCLCLPFSYTPKENRVILLTTKLRENVLYPLQSQSKLSREWRTSLVLQESSHENKDIPTKCSLCLSRWSNQMF